MIKDIFRKIIPDTIKKQYHHKQVFKHYQKLRHIPGNTYRRFDETKSIFIHIPKAGGISIIKSLYGDEAGGFGHRTYKHFEYIFGEKLYHEYFKFTFVRNPFDRLLSAYIFLKKGGINPVDKRFNEEFLSHYQSFEDFVLNGLTEENVSNLEKWTHFFPQHKFIYDENDNLMVDFIGRFENFNEDYEKIRQMIGTGEGLKHLNKTKDKKENSYREVYSQEMREKVANIYQKDFDLFGYTF